MRKLALTLFLLGFSGLAAADYNEGDHNQSTETDYTVTDTLSTGDVFQAVFTGKDEGSYIDNVTLKSMSYDGVAISISSASLGYYTSGSGQLTEHSGTSGLHISKSGSSQNNFNIAVSDSHGESFSMSNAKALLGSSQTYDMDDAKTYDSNGHLVDHSFTVQKNLSSYGIGDSSSYVEWDDTSNALVASSNTLTATSSSLGSVVSTSSTLPEANILPLLAFGLAMPAMRRRRA